MASTEELDFASKMVGTERIITCTLPFAMAMKKGFIKKKNCSPAICNGYSHLVNRSKPFKRQ